MRTYSSLAQHGSKTSLFQHLLYSSIFRFSLKSFQTGRIVQARAKANLDAVFSLVVVNGTFKALDVRYCKSL